MGVTERLGARVPREAVFAEDDGRPFTLASLSGRPLLLSFNYTGCPRLCGLQLGGMARALHQAGWKGARFSAGSMLTVSTENSSPDQLRSRSARAIPASWSPQSLGHPV